jgi:hypothetical protein
MADAGLAAATELGGRLGVIEAPGRGGWPSRAAGPRFGGGEVLTGTPAAQLAGGFFLTGLDQQRTDGAAQQTMPVQGLASATAAGLTRRLASDGGVRLGRCDWAGAVAAPVPLADRPLRP